MPIFRGHALDTRKRRHDDGRFDGSLTPRGRSITVLDFHLVDRCVGHIPLGALAISSNLVAMVAEKVGIGKC